MNILLVVSGSISCYKSFDLLRLYVKENHHVTIVLTKGAECFVKPELYSFLGAKNVYCFNDDFDKKLSKTTPLHIALARWTDLFIVAPMSAGLLARFSSAQATDLASCIFLALDNQINKCFYPAMNTKMLEHSFVKDNFKRLQTLPNSFTHSSVQGTLACGEEGYGKLPSVEEIFFTSIFFRDSSQNDIDKNIKNLKDLNIEKKVLITTGATIAPIDPVRLLTNPASGKTGFYLALEALKRNFKVVVIAGINATTDLDLLIHLPNFTLKRVDTTKNLFKIVKEKFSDCDYYLSPAAISDFTFKCDQKKIKKQDFLGTLNYETSPDILKYLIKIKKEKQLIVGFAAESELTDQNIKQKYLSKPVDLLVGTKVNQGNTKIAQEGFYREIATYKILKNKEKIFSGELKKEELAAFIFNQLLIIDPKEDVCFN